MFDRSAALALVESGRCACEGCSGELTDATLSRGAWQFCRGCRCAWKVSTINGQSYAASIHAPAHLPPPVVPHKSRLEAVEPDS